METTNTIQAQDRTVSSQEEKHTSRPQYAHFKIHSSFVSKPFLLVTKDGKSVNSRNGKPLKKVIVSFPYKTRLNGVDVSDYRFDVIFEDGRYDFQNAQINNDYLTLSLLNAEKGIVIYKGRYGSKDYKEKTINSAFYIAKAIKAQREYYNSLSHEKKKALHDEWLQHLKEINSDKDSSKDTKDMTEGTSDSDQIVVDEKSEKEVVKNISEIKVEKEEIEVNKSSKHETTHNHNKARDVYKRQQDRKRSIRPRHREFDPAFDVYDEDNIAADIEFRAKRLAQRTTDKQIYTYAKEKIDDIVKEYRQKLLKKTRAFSFGLLFWSLFVTVGMCVGAASLYNYAAFYVIDEPTFAGICFIFAQLMGVAFIISCTSIIIDLIIVGLLMRREKNKDELMNISVINNLTSALMFTLFLSGRIGSLAFAAYMSATASCDSTFDNIIQSTLSKKG